MINLYFFSSFLGERVWFQVQVLSPYPTHQDNRRSLSVVLLFFPPTPILLAKSHCQLKLNSASRHFNNIFLKFKSFIASLRWRYPLTALNFGSISCRAVPNSSLPLITVFPVTHPIGVNAQLTHDILDIVGSLEADTQLWKHIQMVNR
jgi:hypothetical protein